MGGRIPLAASGLGAYLARMEIVAKLRAALKARGYLEVITPILLPAPPPDPEIEPFIAPYRPTMQPDPPARPAFLHTSPELEMKRLLCRGLTAIHQIGPAFRQGERGPLHCPEFIMAEWYRVGWGQLELMAELETILVELVGPKLSIDGADLQLVPPLPRVPVADAFGENGLDLKSWDRLAPPAWKDRFHRAFVDRIEPWLKTRGALFLVDFPAPLALLARLNPQRPEVSDRFELVVAGVELANGCAELTDPADYRARFRAEREERTAGAKPVHPLPEDFLADLERLGLPPAAGVALGVDRLALLATGAAELAALRPTPFLG